MFLPRIYFCCIYFPGESHVASAGYTLVSRHAFQLFPRSVPYSPKLPALQPLLLTPQPLVIGADPGHPRLAHRHPAEAAQGPKGLRAQWAAAFGPLSLRAQPSPLRPGRGRRCSAEAGRGGRCALGPCGAAPSGMGTGPGRASRS